MLHIATLNSARHWKMLSLFEGIQVSLVCSCNISLKNMLVHLLLREEWYLLTRLGEFLLITVFICSLYSWIMMPEVSDIVNSMLKNIILIGIDPPRGVLLYGPPGTGKTMLVKAVANHTNAAFIRVVGSKFVQKYLGEVWIRYLQLKWCQQCCSLADFVYFWKLCVSGS